LLWKDFVVLILLEFRDGQNQSVSSQQMYVYTCVCINMTTAISQRGRLKPMFHNLK